MKPSQDARPGVRIPTRSGPESASECDGDSAFLAWTVSAQTLVAGRYRLRSQLGCGGMGIVWRAHDNLLGRSVALKQVFLRGLGPGEVTTIQRQSRTEARAVARVDHPGVLRIHDLVEDDTSMWLVTELLSGCTLGEALGAEGPRPVEAVTRIALGLLDALGAAHQAGIVHRDVKPANVYLCDDGRVVLIDFGIAQTVDDESTIASGEFVGSPAYVAPERIEAGEVGPASDLFSLGATLFAAVEGVSPFRRGSIFETISSVVNDEPGPFVRAGALRPVIEGLLAKQPERRLNAEAARDALEAISAQDHHRRRAEPATSGSRYLTGRAAV